MPPELKISPEKVCFVVVKARELDVKIPPEELDEGTDPTDDGNLAVLEDDEDDPILEELNEFLGAQSDEELEDLLALLWLGQGDFALDEWEDALDAARDTPKRNMIRELIGTPLLGDLLEEGLVQFGLSCEEVELRHL